MPVALVLRIEVVGGAAITDRGRPFFRTRRPVSRTVDRDRLPEHMPIRLDKLVAERFGLSRRASQEAIRNGRIDLDGERCDEPGREVEPDAALAFFPNRPKARKVQGRLRRLARRSAHPDRRQARRPAHPAHGRSRARHAAGPGGPLPGCCAMAAGRMSGSSIGSTRTRRAHWRSRARRRRCGRSRSSSRPTTSSGSIWPWSRAPCSASEGTIRPGPGHRPRRPAPRRRQRAGAGPVGRHPLPRGRAVRPGRHARGLLAGDRPDPPDPHPLAEMGHPVVGERVYRPRACSPAARPRSTRQALHAQTLGFVHPLTGQTIRVEAPAARRFGRDCCRRCGGR